MLLELEVSEGAARGGNEIGSSRLKRGSNVLACGPNEAVRSGLDVSVCARAWPLAQHVGFGHLDYPSCTGGPSHIGALCFGEGGAGGLNGVGMGLEGGRCLRRESSAARKRRAEDSPNFG